MERVGLLLGYLGGPTFSFPLLSHPVPSSLSALSLSLVSFSVFSSIPSFPLCICPAQAPPLPPPHELADGDREVGSRILPSRRGGFPAETSPSPFPEGELRGGPNT